MRIPAFIFIFSFCLISSYAQKKGSLPVVQKQMPDKDGVVVIDNIVPGKSKVYNWHSSGVVLNVGGIQGTSGTFCVLRNGRSAAKTYPVNKKHNNIYVRLSKGDNTLVLKTNQEEDEIHIRMADKEMKYNITAQLKKGINDTIIIKRH